MSRGEGALRVLLCALACLSCLAGLTLLTRPAYAADDKARRAAEHFAMAESAEKRGDFATAIAEYKEAYALKAHPSVLYNIAADYEKLEDWESAVEYYQRYLDASPDAEDRDRVEKKVVALRERASASRPRPTAPQNGVLVIRGVDGATVTIDGRPAGTIPAQGEIAAGPHHLKVSHPGYAAEERDVTIAAGGTEEVHFELTPDGTTDPDDPALRAHYVFGFTYGYDLKNAEVYRYLINLGVRMFRGRWELGAYFGQLGYNDTGVGAETRIFVLGGAAFSPYIRGSATLGNATHSLDKFRTYGLEGGPGIIWAPQHAQAQYSIEYILELDARLTFGGVQNLGDGSDDNKTFALMLQGGIQFRY